MTYECAVHDKEPIGAALRRFKKLIERSGMQKELRSRQHYEKPCEVRRRGSAPQRANGQTGSRHYLTVKSWAGTRNRQREHHEDWQTGVSETTGGREDT